MFDNLDSPNLSCFENQLMDNTCCLENTVAILDDINYLATKVKPNPWYGKTSSKEMTNMYLTTI